MSIRRKRAVRTRSRPAAGRRWWSNWSDWSDFGFASKLQCPRRRKANAGLVGQCKQTNHKSGSPVEGLVFQREDGPAYRYLVVRCTFCSFVDALLVCVPGRINGFFSFFKTFLKQPNKVVN